jgi:hypothetical protein
MIKEIYPIFFHKRCFHCKNEYINVTMWYRFRRYCQPAWDTFNTYKEEYYLCQNCAPTKEKARELMLMPYEEYKKKYINKEEKWEGINQYI